MIFPEAAIKELIEDFRVQVADELRNQGHRLTGKLERSMRTEVNVKGNKILAILYLEEYYIFLEYEMRPGRTPYRRGSGAGSSKVVQELIKAFTRYGASDPKAAAFATLNKWAKEGRPTRASYRFSRNGRRTGFLSFTIKQFEKGLPERLGAIFAKEAENHFVAMVRRFDQVKKVAS